MIANLEQVVLLEPEEEGTRFTQVSDLDLALSWMMPQAMIYGVLGAQMTPRNLNSLAKVVKAGAAEGGPAPAEEGEDGAAAVDEGFAASESEDAATATTAAAVPAARSPPLARRSGPPPRRAVAASAASVEELAKQVATLRSVVRTMSTKLDIAMSLLVVLLAGRLLRAMRGR